MKKIMIIGLVLVTILSLGIYAAGPGGSTMTRTVTPSFGPSGQIFTVTLTATKGSGDMMGIIRETKPSNFEFYDEGSWISSFDLMASDIDGDYLDIAFAESGASGYFEYKLQAGSSSGTLSGNVEWAENGIDNLGEATLTICVDSDGDGYNTSGGVCGPIDCKDNDIKVNPGATETCNGADDDCDSLIDEDFTNLGDSCTVGLGVCQASGSYICVQNGLGTECDAIAGLPTGDDDNCNGADENCDDIADNNYIPTQTSCGIGVCAATGQLICVGGNTQGTCTPGDPSAEVCDGLDNDCDSLIDDNCGAAFILVNSPKEEDYNNRRVLFNISLAQTSDYLKYIDLSARRPRNTTLCRNCLEYGLLRKRMLSLSDGEHNLVFYAIKGGNTYEEAVSLFIDSQAPRIIKTEPRSGYASGLFEVDFTEENPTKVLLTYGISGDYTEEQLDITKCSLKREKYNCNSTVNLAHYDGNKIDYWFNVTDRVGYADMSRPISLKVDMTPPHITNAEWKVEGRYLYLNISLDDKARQIKYIDQTAKRPTEKLLCSNCIEYGASRAKRNLFSKGNHTIDIIAEDQAGNRDTEEGIVFTIA